MCTRILVSVLGVLGLSWSSWAQEMTVSCLAITPESGTVQDETTGSAVLPGDLIDPGHVLSTDAAAQSAFLLSVVRDAQSACDASLFLQEGTSVHVAPQAAYPRQVGLNRGTMTVCYRSRDPLPLVVKVGDGWVRLAGGILVVSAGVPLQVTLVEGEATRFAGDVPAEPQTAAAGGEQLVAKPGAEVNVEARTRIAGLIETALTGASEEWLNRAKFDSWVPSARAPTIEKERILAVFRVSGSALTQPQNIAAVTSAVSGNIVATPVAAANQAQSLIASQTPASVVVGARLERTRIVGSPGTATGEIRFNTEARPPLRLSE